MNHQTSLFEDEAPQFEGLHSYDLVVINTSGGKDSICAISEIMLMAQEVDYPKDRIHLSHQILPHSEWPGVLDLVKHQANYFGLPDNLHFSQQQTKDGVQTSILDRVRSRGMWPSPHQRWCTSDYKRGPGDKVMRKLANEFQAKNVLYVYGFRADESDARKKLIPYSLEKRLCTRKRTVYKYYPIHHWNTKDVWQRIKGYGIPYHYAYDLGMPRLSCMFCIMAPQEAIMIAAHYNPEAFEEHLKVERETGHTFSYKWGLEDVKDRLEKEGPPDSSPNWSM
jgi:3'-phosphoadenosine 5'-phosphosulfate sulfotransferase (PAPS reductase)/FAD synthetase